MAEERCIYDLKAKDLIQLKELRLQDIRKKQWEIITKEHEIKNSEAILLLNTDFKALGYTNEKQRNAFIQDSLSGEKLALTMLKHELRMQEDDLQVINDLLSLRLKEIGE